MEALTLRMQTLIAWGVIGTAWLVALLVIAAGFRIWDVLAFTRRKAARDDIDQAVAMVCKPCSWTDLNARCTCPDKGCTAMTCPKRQVRR